MDEAPPSWKVKLDAARAVGIASLTEDERRARALAQSAAVIAGRQRKAEAKTRAHKINEFAIEGMKPLEISFRLGVTDRRLLALKGAWGLIVAGRVGFRRLFAWVADDHVAALDRLAADMGLERRAALAELLAAALADDAFVARRTLQIRRKISA